MHYKQEYVVMFFECEQGGADQRTLSEIEWRYTLQVQQLPGPGFTFVLRERREIVVFQVNIEVGSGDWLGLAVNGGESRAQSIVAAHNFINTLLEGSAINWTGQSDCDRDFTRLASPA